MGVLTSDRAKPALPFAGHYQLIDIALSNIANSGITDVWVSVQYRATSLARHVAGGRPWDLDRTHGGLQWLPPQQRRDDREGGFAGGNADDLLLSSQDIKAFDADAVIVLSADHVFALDLSEVVAGHLARGSACTVVTTEVTRRQAAAKAVVSAGRDGRVTRVDYKPDDPATTTIATEIFVYDPAALIAALQALHAASPEDGLGDFGERLLPRLVAGGRVHTHAMAGYWRDLGTPSDYLAAHRDLVRGRLSLLSDPQWPIQSVFPELPPARIRAGAVVEDSVLSAGCDIRGTVRGSVLGPGVTVAPGAVVEDSVIFARSRIGADAHVRTAIVDAHVRVGRGAVVGTRADGPGALKDEQVTLVGKGRRVRPT